MLNILVPNSGKKEWNAMFCGATKNGVPRQKHTNSQHSSVTYSHPKFYYADLRREGVRCWLWVGTCHGASRLWWRCLAMTSTLAYYTLKLITAVQIFIILTYGQKEWRVKLCGATRLGIPRLEWRCLNVTNTLAYYTPELITNFLLHRLMVRKKDVCGFVEQLDLGYLH